MTALHVQELLLPLAWPFTPLEWPLAAGASGVGHMVDVKRMGVWLEEGERGCAELMKFLLGDCICLGKR